MCDHLAHRSFDTDHALVRDVLGNELGPLRNPVRTLLEQSSAEPSTGAPRFWDAR